MRLNRPVGIQPLTGLRHSAWSEVVVSGEVDPPTFRFSGVAYVRLLPVVRVLCTVADRCCEPLAAAVAVTVAVSRMTDHVWASQPPSCSNNRHQQGKGWTCHSRPPL